MKKLALVLFAGLAAVAPVVRADDLPSRPGTNVPQPTVTLPPDGIKGYALWDAWFELEPFGYEEQEYFISGVATSLDGSSTAPYTTRIIVFRPDTIPGNGPEFSGLTLMEWVNVTSQYEQGVDFVEAIEYLLREGHAWVHVSAQAVGLDGPVTPFSPKDWDPERYDAIDHPGDAYSHSMFSQIAKALKDGGENGILPMGTLDLEYLLASGQSQSAGHLTTHVNLVAPIDDVIDGFLLQGVGTGPAVSPVPVIHLQSEGDANGAEPSPDPNIVLWEVAGSAHVDLWLARIINDGTSPRASGEPKQTPEQRAETVRVAGNYGAQVDPFLGVCPFGAAFPMRYVVSMAIERLHAWVRSGTPAVASDRVVTDQTGSVVAGEYGNGLGGIRLATIVHPVATHEPSTCGLGGVTVPFSDAQLLAIYGSHTNYFALTADAAQQNIDDGWLLPEDRDDLLRHACAASNRFGIFVADADADGVLDCADNCPFRANPDQSDLGGIGLESRPDGIGDVCQCGDVNDDGKVTGNDASRIRRGCLGLEPFEATQNCSVSQAAPERFNVDKCDVGYGRGGEGACSGNDGTVVRRATLGLLPPILNTCPADRPNP